MSLSLIVVVTSPVGFPRVSGDEPWFSGRAELRVEFSPRERG